MSTPDDTAAFLGATGRAHGRIGLCRQIPGGPFEGTPVDAAALAAGQHNSITAGQPTNVWAGAGLLRSGSIPGGRGKAPDVTGLPSLFADLDIEVDKASSTKASKAPSIEVAEAIVVGVSVLLGVQPCAVVASGHGLQPWWRLEDEDGVTSWAEGDVVVPARMAAALRGFGRLVGLVADRHDASVDHVFELARVMRLPFPGGVNHKPETAPCPVALLKVDPGAARVKLADLEALIEVHAAMPATVAPPVAPKADQPAPGQQRPTRTPREAKLELSIIDGEVQRLLDLPRPWHERAGWDATTHAVACQLLELANAEWSAITLEEAHLLVLDNAPSDEVWNEAEAKWRSALVSVGDKVRDSPTPHENRDDPFSPGYVPPDAEEKETKAKTKGKPEAEDQPPPAVRVAKYALARYEPHLSPDGEPFAVPLRGPRLLIPLGEKGGSLRARVAGELYRATGEVFGAEAMNAGVGILRSDALGRTTHTPIHLRVASTTSRMVIDLGQPNNTRCVVIDGSGWNIYDEPPPGLLFRRPASLRPLPDPVRGGSLDPLRVLLGFTAQDRRWQLVRGWLVASTLGAIPRPMLMLLGPAGSGKTSRGLLIINVLDPRSELGSSFGRNADDDQVKALSRYLVGYDNLTSLSEAVMGHLCRLVTGESAEKRKNYSDTETVVVSYKRTGVLTAITLPQVRADTLDRLIPLHLDPMPPGARSSETRLHATFDAAHPGILGAVCDGAAAMLSRFPQLIEEDVSGPRNMDYALALQAYDPGCSAAYQEAADDVLVTAAEDDPFVVTVRDWLLSWAKSTGVRERVNEPAEAFAAVTHYARSRDDFASTWWPTKPKAFTQTMTRAAGPLAAVGVTFRAGQTKGRRVWRFELSEEAAR